MEQAELQTGKRLLGDGETLKALALFEKAYYRTPHDPEVQSYYALVAALERGQFGRSLALAREAVERMPDSADLHRNLGRLYLRMGDKAEGIRHIRQSRQLAPEDRESVNLLASLGNRARPVFPFFPRKHFLNRYLGLIVHRLRLRSPAPP